MIATMERIPADSNKVLIGWYTANERKMMNAERRTYWNLLRIKREGLTGALVRIGIDPIRCLSAPAWISVSSVYENFDSTNTCAAAARENARKPVVTSGTFTPTAMLTIRLPKLCKRRLKGEKYSSVLTSRSPN